MKKNKIFNKKALFLFIINNFMNNFIKFNLGKIFLLKRSLSINFRLNLFVY